MEDWLAIILIHFLCYVIQPVDVSKFNISE